MNFLLRSTTHNHIAPPPDPETTLHPPKIPKPTMTLEGLIAEDPYTENSAAEDQVDENVQDDGLGGKNDSDVGESRKDELPIAQKHLDVGDEEGWIVIPNQLLPTNWKEASDTSSFRHLDRSFVFPGEQVHILACLSACKKDTEIITPFKVAAVMNKNGRSTKTQNGNMENETNAESGHEKRSPGGQDVELNSEILVNEEIQQQKDFTSGESLLRLEDHKRQTEMLLQNFMNSHFFVRIAEADEPLWSKRSSPGSKNTSVLNAVIDRGNFNSSVSGGVARDAVECCCLPNGDIVVLIQVNVGADFLKYPILEILQFEKHQDRYRSSESLIDNRNQDPCEDLLKWLLPIDNTVSPLGRPLSPPRFTSSSSGSSTTIKSSFSASFGHFRSYSMSSLPQNTTGSPQPVTNSSSRPNINLEDWDRFSSQKPIKSQKVGNEGLLSFRGVSLEPDRFSVCCGLEGIYIPGRRWRKKLEIVQPVDIHSFAADCNTDDLLCVQIKNVSPVHISDLMIYIDAITIVFEEASKGGPAASLPIACIEAGNRHNLPNLALRRGEVHSFILKPATSTWKNNKVISESGPRSSHLQTANALSNLRLPSKVAEGKKSPLVDQYSVLVSCRCNYSESKLFFKQQTSWRPRISRDLMISVASEIARPSFASSGSVSQLPVQVLNLQASNLTSEDLTLTVLAPASFISPSVVSLNSSPSLPASSFIDFSEFTGNGSGEKDGSISQNGDSGARSVFFNEQTAPISDVISNTSLNCSHLWLQSRVPLGCVPPQSTATIKLELLPLTDGIITPDTLQILVKEKGLTYIPEHSLKINATSSISTGIL